MIKKFTLTATILLLTMTIAMIIISTVEARKAHRPLIGMTECIATELTEEQRTAIHDKVVGMREDGAARDEIRAEVAKMLEEYGVEVPEDWFSRGGNGNYLFADLTDEQRTAIHDKVVEMREEGATRDEIREVVAEMLEEYGVEVPEDWTNLSKLRGKDRIRDKQGLRERICADIVIIDSEIQAAPEVSSHRFRRMAKVWARFKSN